MTASAPRSIAEYLRQLRAELVGEDPALIQDALYDAEEYLRAEVAAHPEKTEADVLELIAATYGAPDEVANAYRETESRVKAALRTPGVSGRALGAGNSFFGVFLDVHAYTSLFFMLLSLATGILYFTFAVAGLSISFGCAVLVIGVPFFLMFMALTRVLSLAEGRLIEAMTGERMPRRPEHPGPAQGFWLRIGLMLKDPRTWSTLAYLLLMLPLGIIYFAVASVGLTVSLSLIFAPLFAAADRWSWVAGDGLSFEPSWVGSVWALPILVALGVVLLTLLMHLARGIGRLHAVFAKAFLVSRPGLAAA
jgi:uncharacterized membrane protein